MQQELIEMLEEIIQYVEVWKSQDQEVIDKAEALIEKAKNNAPAVPQDSDPTSKEQYRRMFVAACEALGAISDVLGCDPEDGGAEPILGAVEELHIGLGLSNGILGCLSAAPAVPDGLQWFTVAEHGIPEIGAEVIGGLWYTDPWIKTEFATTFMWGQCRVVESKHRDFKDGKQWCTFGPSHNQITHWARINTPGQTSAPAPAPEVGLTDDEIEAIAKKHMSTVGDHWSNEEAIREIHAEDFARDIIAALRAKENKL